MEPTKYKYIQNTQNFPVTANIRDEKGKVIESIKFMPAIRDKWSEKMVTTGYTRITLAQYDALVKTSRTWDVYGEKKRFLVAHDDVPAELKSPHEAIRDARKELLKAEAKVKNQEAEIADLKARLFDAETKYKELSSASTEEEKLKPFNDKIAALEAENKEFGALNLQFVKDLEELVKEDKKAKELLDVYTAKFAEFTMGAVKEGTAEKGAA
jgi:hypothetical protein